MNEKSASQSAATIEREHLQELRNKIGDVLSRIKSQFAQYADDRSLEKKIDDSSKAQVAEYFPAYFAEIRTVIWDCEGNISQINEFLNSVDL